MSYELRQARIIVVQFGRIKLHQKLLNIQLSNFSVVFKLIFTQLFQLRGIFLKYIVYECMSQVTHLCIQQLYKNKITPLLMIFPVS